MDGIVARDVRSGAQVLSPAVGVLVVCVAEARAPMAEIGADDEEVGSVREVGGKEAAQLALSGGAGVADHYGDESYGLGVGFEGFVVAGGWLLARGGKGRSRRTVRASCRCMAGASRDCAHPHRSA